VERGPARAPDHEDHGSHGAPPRVVGSIGEPGSPGKARTGAGARRDAGGLGHRPRRDSPASERCPPQLPAFARRDSHIARRPSSELRYRRPRDGARRSPGGARFL
jgi:hypothetical protein